MLDIVVNKNVSVHTQRYSETRVSADLSGELNCITRSTGEENITLKTIGLILFWEGSLNYQLLQLLKITSCRTAVKIC